MIRIKVSHLSIMIGIFSGVLFGTCMKYAYLHQGGQSGTPIILRTARKEKSIKVNVLGEVLNPGMVTLPEGGRAYDAIIAAGGLLSEADDSEINLAARLEDGQILLIPNKYNETQTPKLSQYPIIDSSRIFVPHDKYTPASGKRTFKGSKLYISEIQIAWITGICGIGIVISLILLIFLIEKINCNHTDNIR